MAASTQCRSYGDVDPGAGTQLYTIDGQAGGTGAGDRLPLASVATVAGSAAGHWPLRPRVGLASGEEEHEDQVREKRRPGQAEQPDEQVPQQEQLDHHPCARRGQLARHPEPQAPREARAAAARASAPFEMWTACEAMLFSGSGSVHLGPVVVVAHTG